MKLLRNPLLKRAAISAINPDEPQFLAEAATTLEQQTSAIAVVQSGRGDQNGQDQTHRIDENVSFASCDPFATIIASYSCGCDAGLDCLTIDTPGRWMLMSSDLTAHFGA